MQLMQNANIHYVVDIDIQGFFDNVWHGKLILQTWSMVIRDKKLLSIIRAMLKAPVKLPNGQIETPQKAPPQGDAQKKRQSSVQENTERGNLNASISIYSALILGMHN